MQTDNRGQTELWLIDLHALNSKQLTASAAIENLSLLNQFLFRHSTNADRLRFFRAYWKTLQNQADQQAHHPFAAYRFKSVLRKTWAACSATLFQNFTKLDRKWSRGNRRQIIINNGTTHCRGLSEIGQQQLQQLCSQLDINAALQPSINSEACPALQGSLFTWKSATGQSTSPAEHIWTTGHAFLRRGLTTAKPQMFITRSHGNLTEEYLVQTDVTIWPTLCEYIEQQGQFSTALQQRLASRIAFLHECGFDYSGWQGDTLRIATHNHQLEIVFCNLHAIQQRQLSKAERFQSLQNLCATLPQLPNVGLMKFAQLMQSYAFFSQCNVSFPVQQFFNLKQQQDAA